MVHNSIETEPALAVDVMMTRAKRIYILIIRVRPGSYVAFLPYRMQFKQNIMKQIISLSISCLNCIRHGRNATYEPGLNKLFLFRFVAVFSKRNRKHVLLVSCSPRWGELEKAAETLSSAHVPTAFLVLPNVHLSFYNSTESVS